MLPWVLKDVDLGDNALEIGPGPGRTTEWLRGHVPHLTAVEIDRALAESLKKRLAGPHLTVVEGDATDMQFPDAAFSGAICMTMLHHVPSPALQDKLLAETFRVLRAGATFAGCDSTPTLRWRLFHIGHLRRRRPGRVHRASAGRRLCRCDGRNERVPLVQVPCAQALERVVDGAEDGYPARIERDHVRRQVHLVHRVADAHLGLRVCQPERAAHSGMPKERRFWR